MSQISGHVALGHPHVHALQLRSQASVWSLVATWATDIYTDPCCGRTKDPDMILGISPDPDVSVLPAGSAWHFSHSHSQESMAHGHQNGLRYQSRNVALVHSSMALGTMGIKTYPDWGKAMDSDMVLDFNHGLDNTMTPVDNTGH